MADVTKQIAKWNAKFDTARIKATLDAMRPDMAAHVAAVFPQMAEKDTEVKQTLDALGLPSIQYPFYMCFGRSRWSAEACRVSPRPSRPRRWWTSG